LDFTYGYFEICPIDALIQRMGRVNRNGNFTEKILQANNLVFFKTTINDEKIYAPDLVQRTINVLNPAQNKLLTEMDLLNFVEAIYPSYQPDQQAEFQRGINHETAKNFFDKLQIGFQQEWVTELIENADAHIDVLPKECVAEFNSLWEQQEYLKAKELLISIHIHTIKKEEIKSGKVSSIKILDSPRFEYSVEMGLLKKRN
jgi:CRISPR-associated endonuclease/helicase Cas3